MVFIAQLSTVDGMRSPLAHVADEVFVSLVRELESQGVALLREVEAQEGSSARQESGARAVQQGEEDLDESPLSRGGLQCHHALP
jgi:hypothetical protein